MSQNSFHSVCGQPASYLLIFGACKQLFLFWCQCWEFYFTSLSFGCWWQETHLLRFWGMFSFDNIIIVVYFNFRTPTLILLKCKTFLISAYSSSSDSISGTGMSLGSTGPSSGWCSWPNWTFPGMIGDSWPVLPLGSLPDPCGNHDTSGSPSGCCDCVSWDSISSGWLYCSWSSATVGLAPNGAAPGLGSLTMFWPSVRSWYWVPPCLGTIELDDLVNLEMSSLFWCFHSSTADRDLTCSGATRNSLVPILTQTTWEPSWVITCMGPCQLPSASPLFFPIITHSPCWYIPLLGCLRWIKALRTVWSLSTSRNAFLPLSKSRLLTKELATSLRIDGHCVGCGKPFIHYWSWYLSAFSKHY